jgi:hypothetical protein
MWYASAKEMSFSHVHSTHLCACVSHTHACHSDTHIYTDGCHIPLECSRVRDGRVAQNWCAQQIRGVHPRDVCPGHCTQVASLRNPLAPHCARKPFAVDAQLGGSQLSRFQSASSALASAPAAHERRSRDYEARTRAVAPPGAVVATAWEALDGVARQAPDGSPAVEAQVGVAACARAAQGL